MLTRRQTLTLAGATALPGTAFWQTTDAWAQSPVATPAPAASGAAAIPVEAFFSRPRLAGARFSPDGSKVAMTVSADGNGLTRLALLDLSNMSTRIVAAMSDSHIQRFTWADDQHLVFDTSTELIDYRRIDTGPGLFAVDTAGTAFRQLVDTGGQPPDGVARAELHWRYQFMELPAPQLNSEVLVYRPEEVTDRRIGDFDLRWLHVRTRGTRTVRIPVNSTNWAFDAKGELRAAVVREGENYDLRWRQPDGSWRSLRRWQSLSGEDWWPRWVDAQGKLYVDASHQGRVALFLVDPATGSGADKPVAAHPQFDVHAQPIVRGDALIGLRYTIDAEVTQWLDPKVQALQDQVDKLLPGGVNLLQLPQRGELAWLLVTNQSDKQPPRTLLFNVANQRLTRLGDTLPQIPVQRMGTKDLVWIKARDGRSLPVWLTLPAGARKQNLPMVVMVHGGPWLRGTAWDFDAEAQFLASRGYAVLEPEFRGSTGYGGDHFRAGWKQWGQAMQTDVADATRWAIEQKTADPRRIAIMGASYGGYASLMGLVRDPDLFRAAVAWAAVSDLQMLYSLRWSDVTEDSRRYGLPRLLGDPQAEAEMLRANSPVHLADRMRNPLLLAHGEWDSRVPMDHAEAMLKALRKHNAPVEWVHYKNEGHGWVRPENLADFWRRVERFLAQHLAPPAA